MNETPRIGRAPNEPSPVVIETLERLLEEARDGKIDGLCYAAFGEVTQVRYGLCGPSVEGWGGHLRMAGLLAYLQRRVLEMWDEEGGPEKDAF